MSKILNVPTILTTLLHHTRHNMQCWLISDGCTHIYHRQHEPRVGVRGNCSKSVFDIIRQVSGACEAWFSGSGLGMHYLIE